MRVGIYVLFWLLVAPIVFIIAAGLVIYPSHAMILGVWGDEPHRIVRAAFALISLLGLAFAVAALVWVWRKVKASVAERFPPVG